MDLLQVAQIVIAVAVAASILLQARGTGLSSTFGGGSTAYRSRRGLERTLFRLTVVLSVVYVVISVLGARSGSVQMRARDKFIVVALIALMVVVSGAAIAIDRAETKTIVPTYGGTYVEGVTSAAQYLNPVLAATPVDDDVVRLVFSGLSRYRSDGSIQGDLAQSFSASEDGKVWTFQIRADATWHDGKPVISDDVVYTVALLQDKAYVGPYGDAFRGVKVERVDDRVVRFTLPDAYGPFAASTTVPLLPSHLLAKVDYNGLPRVAFNQHPVGSGPFRVVEADAQQTVLARNDSFYRTQPDRTRPYLDRLVLRSYPDTSEALTALGRGEIDGVGGLSTGDAERDRKSTR